MIKSKLQEINSKHTKIKVALGYLVILIIIFILAYIAFVNFNKITSSIESLSKSKNETTIIKQIDSGILELRTSSEILSNTFKPADYDKYKKNIQHTQQLIDRLQLELMEKGNQSQADSLHNMFAEYVSSINEWLEVKKVSASENNNEIRKLLKKDKNHTSKLNELAPEYTTTTITKIIEKPILKESNEKKDSVSEGAFKRFFKKLFNAEKPKPAPIINTEAIQEIITESSVEKDTLYENQVKEFIAELNKAIVKAEESKKNNNKELARLKKELIDNQTVIIQNLDVLLKDIENENKIKVNKSIELTKVTAEKASVSLIFVVIIALIFSFFFMYAIFSDLTQSARYKQMLLNAKKETEKLAKTKEEFLANMSHEIRTPLTGIIGFSEQLKDQPSAEKQAQILKSIMNSSEHLLAVVNDILDYYKIESGNLHLEKNNFNITEVFERVINIMQFDADKKNLTLIYRPDFKNINTVNGDSLRLQQVLLNLLSNAIKFTEKGTVTINSEWIEKTDSYVLKCSVIDTGIGINEQELQNIFLDFTQADSSITRKYGGTGLGLPICKKIIESQNGIISVTSTLEKGSCFYFEIPYEKPFTETTQPNLIDNAELLKSKSVIVVDDDITTEKLLTPIFNSAQMESTFCRISKQGWELLKLKTFDLVILDIQMPEMDGKELIQKILLDSESKNKQSKIIVCTANIMINQNELKQWSPNIQIIYKPYRKKDFLNLLNLSFEHSKELKVTSPTLLYDLNSFNQFASGDADLLKSFVASFIQESKTDLLQMRLHLTNHQFKSIGEIAHKLKNAYGHLSIKNALVIILELEKLITDTQPDLKTIEAQLNELEQISNEVFKHLESDVLNT